MNLVQNQPMPPRLKIVAEEVLLCGLKSIPMVGKAIEVISAVESRHAVPAQGECPYISRPIALNARLGKPIANRWVVTRSPDVSIATQAANVSQFLSRL